MESNERVALLLGWKFERASGDWLDDGWTLFCAGGCALKTQKDPPDYTSWERFPEMQEYVRGLSVLRQQLIWEEVKKRTEFVFHHEILTAVTPEIWRDSILAIPE